MSECNIILAHPWEGHQVNEIVSLEIDRARQIVQAGAARYVDDEPAPEVVADVPSADEAPPVLPEIVPVAEIAPVPPVRGTKASTVSDAGIDAKS